MSEEPYRAPSAREVVAHVWPLIEAGRTEEALTLLDDWLAHPPVPAGDVAAIAHVATGQVKSVCSLAPDALLDVAWSPDGRHIATVEGNFAAEEGEVLYCLCIRTVEGNLF